VSPPTPSQLPPKGVSPAVPNWKPGSTSDRSGAGLNAIAEGLSRDDIPSPSAHDPERNRHRRSSNGAWSKSAVRAILANPRYTGFEVWNKQRADEVLLDIDDVAQGRSTKMRWNDTSA
jgi:site-specific DNA recombinase